MYRPTPPRAPAARPLPQPGPSRGSSSPHCPRKAGTLARPPSRTLTFPPIRTVPHAGPLIGATPLRLRHLDTGALLCLDPQAERSAPPQPSSTHKQPLPNTFSTPTPPSTLSHSHIPTTPSSNRLTLQPPASAPSPQPHMPTPQPARQPPCTPLTAFWLPASLALPHRASHPRANWDDGGHGVCCRREAATAPARVPTAGCTAGAGAGCATAAP